MIKLEVISQYKKLISFSDSASTKAQKLLINASVQNNFFQFID